MMQETEMTFMTYSTLARAYAHGNKSASNRRKVAPQLSFYLPFSSNQDHRQTLPFRDQARGGCSIHMRWDMIRSHDLINLFTSSNSCKFGSMHPARSDSRHNRSTDLG